MKNTTRRTILVVDDNERLLGVMERILERDDYRVLRAASGVEALRVLETAGTAPDLLVTDYIMPGMDGRELAWRVRQRWPAVKVLYQTGFAARLFGAGRSLEPNSAFIEKPFSIRGVREAASHLLSGTMRPMLTSGSV